MVRLKPAQEKLLEELTTAKAIYDAEQAQFESWVAQQKELRKQRIRVAVGAAESAGIPNLRIYKALGFDQPGPYTNFLKPVAGGAGAPVNAVWEPPQTAPSAEPRHAVASWSPLNNEGDEWWAVDVVDTDGTLITSVVDIDLRVTDRTAVDPGNGWWYYKGETKDEVKKAINEFLEKEFDRPVSWE
jgi:hypothetical protein